MGSRSIALA